MAVVPAVGEQTQLEGEQTIVASEPDNLGIGPESLGWKAPDYLQSRYTPPSASAPGTGLAPSGGNALRDKLIAAGMRYIGQPYSWGNLDCSGLVQRAYAAVGIHLPRVSYQQANSGKRVGINSLSPGDLVAWEEGPQNPGADHVAIFIGFDAKGRPQILEAAHTGSNVRVRTLGSNEGAWGVQMNVG